ncbi:uncharacterized protein L969DRAFT_84602 [Mixia osmundae IAM 14324]|uniref:Thioesterase domain-containing protein n=1 Tax=Mixia osmundae (strain CBS 9802 / IAM 14324 / JCM 22182 / KY 12970) TaxID=764103 RepID=G7DT56_MIXOS|nr:uncharacterized protein L969DRAFT_84602 [Mixia osmundae IAM 14324]KEI42731.1 hypothetical protein L969DRAFT_84602 [Mixia osmundae IAM 14324]GAA93935.1 hypothetical protein E5Q_00581 [Mixia osmundae IAM 14324]
MDKRSHGLIWDKLQSMLGALRTGGFALTTMEAMEIVGLELEGVESAQADSDEPRVNKGAKATVVVELTVAQDMCNMSANMHGGAQAFCLDVCTSMAVMALSSGSRWITAGVTSHLAAHYIAPIPEHSKIRIISKTISQGLRVAVIECRIEDAETGKLHLLGTHTKHDTTSALSFAKL